MRLQTDPYGVIHDTAAQVASVVSTFIPDLSEYARNTIISAIVRYCDNDTERAEDALKYARLVHQKVSSGAKFNPVTALMYGMTPPRTQAEVNLFEFVSSLDGEAITDIRTIDGEKSPELALNIAETVDPADLEAFTPDKHEGALQLIHGLAHVIAEDMGIEGKFLMGRGNTEIVSVPAVTVMLASGMLPTLIRVVNEMDGMTDLPGELLITLYHDDLIAALPNTGVYGDYRNKLTEDAVNAS